MKLKREFKIPENRAGRLQVISSGGGTQSSCMIVLAHMGTIPKPDLVVMADTEYESTDVFPYQEKYIVPLCEEMGVEYVFVNKSDYTDADIHLSESNDTILPPFFTTYIGRTKDGNCMGKQPTWCSDKWKKVVIQRYLNKRFGQQALNKSGVDFWIGMSFDEKRRIKYPAGKWQRRYPLFEAQIVREQAIQIVERYNLPTPPMSACWMCPNRHDRNWAVMSEGDLQLAIEFENKLHEEYPWLWLHKSGKPIGEVDFLEFADKHNQEDILDGFCDSGMCFV